MHTIDPELFPDETHVGMDCLQLEAEILQHVPAVVWTVMPNGQVDFINRYYLDVTGKCLDECVAPPESWKSKMPPFLSGFHPEHRERIQRIFWDGLRSGRGWVFEAPCFHAADGKYHWHLDRAVPVHDSRGRLLRFVGTCADIDDLKQAEAKHKALVAIGNAITAIPLQRPLYTLSPPSYGCPAFASICAALQSVVSFDWAELAIVAHGKLSFQALASHGEDGFEGFAPERELGREKTSLGWVYDCRRPLLRTEIARTPCYVDEGKLADAGICSYAVVPMLKREECIGTLRIASRSAEPFSLEDAEFLSEVAKQLALAVENLKAYEEIASLKAKLQIENSYLQDEIRREHNFEEILGSSPGLLRLLSRVESAAPTDANILIYGETGTGKELIARAIHSRSARRESPLVKVNCGAIPAGLVESELFGHVKGAFTSASGSRVGRFELANGGTLFLDEVGELPLETQVKLLRVLQEQEFEPVGSNRTIKIDVRILAATNRNLEEMVQAGTFRSDLYYRLNVIPLHVPALRERRSDIPVLVTSFLEQYAKRMGKAIRAASQETMKLLQDYAWPGNIRELQNVIERGIVLSKGSILKLGPDMLPVEGSDRALEPEPSLAPGGMLSLREAQRRHILNALETTGWRISGPRGAGATLGVHPNTLQSLMKRLGIERPG